MLELVVFCCGAVVMILEMVGSRILAPYLGSSIVVWTSLIAVVLGSLSVGYWWGGRRADRNASHRELSLVILLAAAFVACMGAATTFVLGFLDDRIRSIHLGSAVAALVLFAPPSVLLGMVSPYAVKLKLRSLERSGNTVGRLYAISTVGSILGTVLGGFVLIALLGTSRILYVLAIVLVLTSLAACAGDRGAKVALFGACAVLLPVTAAHERAQRALGFHDVDTDYNRVVVYDRELVSGERMRIMTTHPKAVQSMMDVGAPDRLVLPYSRFFELASCFRADVGSYLVLGGGAFSFPKHVLAAHPQVRVDVVELDPGVTALASRFFFLPSDPRLAVIHEDARSFLRRTDKRYDAILVDVFNSHFSVPFHLATVEAARQMRDRLAEGGVVVVNLIAALEGAGSRFLAAESATYRAAFGEIRLYPVTSPTDAAVWQNVMLVASRSGHLPEPRLDCGCADMLDHAWAAPTPRDARVLTDDFAPVDTLLF